VLLVTYDAALAAVLRNGLGEAPNVIEPDRFGDAIEPYELIVLDTGPSVDSVCRSLRDRGVDSAILALLEHDDVAARVAVLDAGADDCLAKPLDAGELAARARALVRPRAQAEHARLVFEDVVYDPARQQASRGRRDLELSRTEAALLELFLRNPRQVLPRDLIVERVWGPGSGHRSNTLDVYVGYLRRKLERDGEPRLIQTVRGVGYGFSRRRS
jgi:two-component system response regulator MprA